MHLKKSMSNSYIESQLKLQLLQYRSKITRTSEAICNFRGGGRQRAVEGTLFELEMISTLSRCTAWRKVPTNRFAVKSKKRECFKVGHMVARSGIVFSSLASLNQTPKSPTVFLDCTANSTGWGITSCGMLGQSWNNFTESTPRDPFHCYVESAEAI